MSHFNEDNYIYLLNTIQKFFCTFKKYIAISIKIEHFIDMCIYSKKYNENHIQSVIKMLVLLFQKSVFMEMTKMFII